ncbi:UvrD-helicase domain-containing protein [Propionibacteriaceae bacterium Y1685]
MPQANIVMTKLAGRLDASVRKDAFSFLEKLSTEDTQRGLNIEPVKSAVDPKVRTGRVNLQYRAVLFKLTGDSIPTYVVYGIWNHDEAYEKAEKATLRVNPVNGIAEIRVVTEAESPSAPPRQPGRDDRVLRDAPPGFEQLPSQGGAYETAPPPTEAPAIVNAPQELVQAFDVTDGIAQCIVGLSRSELEAFVDTQPEWLGLALLELADGRPLTDVVATYRDDEFSKVTGADDASVLRGLHHPYAKLTFTQIEHNDEMAKVLEGDWKSWRTFLHPDQLRNVEQNNGGPARLTGGAGTGKTVVLVHRARRLCREAPRSRIALTTFTANLSRAMGGMLADLDSDLPRAKEIGQSGILVAGVDSLVRAVLRKAGQDIETDVAAVLGHGRTEIKPASGDSEWRNALEGEGSDLPPALRNTAFLKAEYQNVILPSRIDSREGYLRARRPGRGVRLGRLQREAVWRVVTAYRGATRVAGTVDFAEAAAIAAEHLRRTSTTLIDHLLVDEGQDLSAVQWQFLRAVTARGKNDMFIAEDAHQRIYGRRVVLGHYDINVRGRRSATLRLNYRTTRENLRFGLDILGQESFVGLADDPETTSGYRSARSGPTPQMMPVDSLGEELNNAADLIRKWTTDAEADGLPPESIAVLVRGTQQRDRVVNGLAERGVEVRAVDRDVVQAGAPVVMTMHRAKGTEFSRVLLFGVNDRSVPISMGEYTWSDEDKHDALLRERSLVYVAATRARDELVCSWSGAASPLLPGEAS